MAEQTSEKKSGAAVKIVVKVIIGIALIVLGILAIVSWWKSLWIVFQGCIGLFLILAGAITLAIAKE